MASTKYPLFSKNILGLPPYGLLEIFPIKALAFKIYNFIVSNYAKAGWLNLNRTIFFSQSERFHHVTWPMLYESYHLDAAGILKAQKVADTEGETMVNLLVACLEILNDGTSEDSMKECAVGILSNLTCNNSTNKEAVIGNDGVAILINTILA